MGIGLIVMEIFTYQVQIYGYIGGNASEHPRLFSNDGLALYVGSRHIIEWGEPKLYSSSFGFHTRFH